MRCLACFPVSTVSKFILPRNTSNRRTSPRNHSTSRCQCKDVQPFSQPPREKEKEEQQRPRKAHRCQIIRFNTAYDEEHKSSPTPSKMIALRKQRQQKRENRRAHNTTDGENTLEYMHKQATRLKKKGFTQSLTFVTRDPPSSRNIFLCRSGCPVLDEYFPHQCARLMANEMDKEKTHSSAFRFRGESLQIEKGQFLSCPRDTKLSLAHTHSPLLITSSTTGVVILEENKSGKTPKTAKRFKWKISPFHPFLLLSLCCNSEVFPLRRQSQNRSQTKPLNI